MIISISYLWNVLISWESTISGKRETIYGPDVLTAKVGKIVEKCDVHGVWLWRKKTFGHVVCSNRLYKLRRSFPESFKTTTFFIFTLHMGSTSQFCLHYGICLFWAIFKRHLRVSALVILPEIPLSNSTPRYVLQTGWVSASVLMRTPLATTCEHSRTIEICVNE